jgi:hypothetical protein
VILEGWHCPNCRVFNGEAKEVLPICRACPTEWPKRITTPMAMALARSLEQGRPDSEIPKSMVFSYVGFSILLARYVQEQTENWRFPPPLSSSPTAGGKESSPETAIGWYRMTGLDKVPNR